jgi:hypothetical protein
MRHRVLWTCALSGGAILAASGLAAQETGVRLSGVSYAEFRVLLSDSANHRNEFDVTRAYLNAIGRFDHGVSTRVTADIYRNADGSLSYRLKYAYFGWNPGGGPATLKFGAIHTPWLDWEEALWGYRMQGTMPIERAGYLTSADLGAGVDLRSSDERVNAQLAVVNGEGYQRPAGGRYRDFEARVSVRLLDSDDRSRIGGLRLTGYGHVGKRTNGGPRDRWIGMASYRSARVVLAGQYAATRDGAADADDPDTDGRVASVYAVLNVPGSDVTLLARIDRTDPNTSVADDAYTRWFGGVGYRLGSNVRLLADLEHADYQAAAPSPAAAAARTRLLFQTEFTF